MDRTLSPAKRSNKRRRERVGRAWLRFSPDGVTCRYCPHNGSVHLCTSGQPHFYRRARPEEERDPNLTLYRYKAPDGTLLLRKLAVARDAELITAFCRACAGELGPHQVLCYQRALATGEALGIDTIKKGDTS